MVAFTRIRLGEDFFRTPIVVPCSSLDHLRKCSSFAPRISVHQQEGNTAYPLWRCTRDSWKAFTDHHTSIPSLLRTCHQKGKRVLYPSGPEGEQRAPVHGQEVKGKSSKDPTLGTPPVAGTLHGQQLYRSFRCLEQQQAEVVEVQRLQSQNEQINVPECSGYLRKCLNFVKTRQHVCFVQSVGASFNPCRSHKKSPLKRRRS